MSLTYRAEPQIVYQANEKIQNWVKAHTGHMHNICSQCHNRLVRAETMDGEVFEGIMIHHDKGVIYLMQPPEPRFFPGPGFGPGFGPGPVPGGPGFVLPLVLFNLLTLSLL